MDVTVMGRGDLEGKTKLPLGDGSTQSKPGPLPAGSFVRITRAKDPWLRRYSGMQARVRQDDGLIVEVLLPCGQLMSFWWNEVEPLSAATDSWAHVGAGPEESHDFRVEHGTVPGRWLQGQRRRAGVTQAAIATVMGVSAPRLSQIEAARAVRSGTAARYLEALRIASPKCGMSDLSARWKGDVAGVDLVRT